MSDKAVILIIDDDIHIIDALKRLLHEINYTIIAVTTPEDAMCIMNSTKLDVVISDYSMPNISGIDVLKYAKKVQPDTARILMTGYCDLNIAISAINEGSVFYYIAKPWRNDEVISVIHDALESIRSRNSRNDLYRYINESQNYMAQMYTKLDSMDKIDGYKNLRVSVLEDENVILINREDILFLTANEGYVFIYANGREYRSHEPLNIWGKKLGSSRFFRCHRSYIINLEKIEKISPWFNGTYNIKLMNYKDNIPVSRENMKVLRELLSL